MQYSADYRGREDVLVDVFRAAFAVSEGAEEGALIADLARGLMARTPTSELFVFSSWEGGAATGCIVFTRLHYPEDPRQVVLLSPVAVLPDYQKRGVGQRLLRFGLDAVRDARADVAITYGDPAYYGKVGFDVITVKAAQPPRPLSFPHGWLGQSLNDKAFMPLKGPSRCASALDDPAYW